MLAALVNPVSCLCNALYFSKNFIIIWFETLSNPLRKVGKMLLFPICQKIRKLIVLPKLPANIRVKTRALRVCWPPRCLRVRHESFSQKSSRVNRTVTPWKHLEPTYTISQLFILFKKRKHILIQSKRALINRHVNFLNGLVLQVKLYVRKWDVRFSRENK